MKKILIVSHVLDYSGASRSLLNLLKKFPKNEYRILLAGMYGGALKEEYKNYVNKLYVVDEKIRKFLLIKAVNKTKGMLKLAWIIWREKPDIILVNSMVNSRAIILGKIFGKYTIVYVREFDEMISNLISFRKKVLLLADKLIAVSYANKDWLCNIGINEDKIEVIYNGIDLEEVEIKSKEEPPKDFINFIGDSRTIAIIGYMTKRKGIDYFVKLMNRLSKRNNNVKFVIIGDIINNDLRKNFHEILRKNNLHQKLFITGIVSNIYKYLKYIDIVVMMSRKEALPRVILEACSLGKPIVLFNVGGSKELLPRNYPYVVEPFNLQLFQKYVEELLRDKYSREKIARNLKEHAKNFSIQKAIAKLVKVIER